MKTSDLDILFVPGLGGSGAEHWQTRWQGRLSTGRRVEQADWDAPVVAEWAERLVETVAAASRPVVLVAHSLGVATVAHAANRLPAGIVRGGFLVALPDVEDPAIEPARLRAFGPLPRDPLPFPSLLVASRNDPYCRYDRAEDISYAWGSALVDAGEAGHVNTEAGFGPWPEGLMRLAGFLKRL
jgi:predicted alpha/beta hydrolase family esterase